MDNEIKEILKHSNWIEREYSDVALKDAIRAWKFAKTNINKVDVKYILKIHYLLCRNIAPHIAGKIRDCDVWIGGYKKHFISESLIKEELDRVVKIINHKKIKKGLEEGVAKYGHVEFEGIHPFCDGNGRVGRILFNIHRIKLGLKPLLIKGPTKGSDQTEDQINYYSWFRK